MDPAAKSSGVPFSQAKEDESGLCQKTNCVVGVTGYRELLSSCFYLPSEFFGQAYIDKFLLKFQYIDCIFCRFFLMDFH